MWDIVVIGLKWSLIALGAAPIVLGIGWTMWEYVIQPRLIPQTEIDRLAQVMVDRYDDPEEAAFIEHYAAWFRSNAYEQGKWLRVRKAIRRRLRELKQ